MSDTPERVLAPIERIVQKFHNREMHEPDVEWCEKENCWYQRELRAIASAGYELGCKETIFKAVMLCLPAGKTKELVGRIEWEARQEGFKKGVAAAQGLDSPWPPRDVVKKLADAVDHLLHEHNCDTHGHEGMLIALTVARDWLAKVEEPRLEVTP